jgi:cytochrome c-type biogenesis protein CcmH/NrfF
MTSQQADRFRKASGARHAPRQQTAGRRGSLLPACSRHLVICGHLVVALTAVSVARAEDQSAHDAHRAHAIASHIMSPFCPGSTVASCSSPRAAEWRADIHSWVKEGVSEQEIRRRLSARVPGHDLSGTPAPALGWFVPIVLAVLAVGLLAILLRRFIPARTGAARRV